METWIEAWDWIEVWEQFVQGDINRKCDLDNVTWFDLWQEMISSEIALKEEGCDPREKELCPEVCPEAAYINFKTQESQNSEKRIQHLSLAGKVLSL